MVLNFQCIPSFNLKVYFTKNLVLELYNKNGMVERIHQYILNMTISFSFQTNLPLNIWTFNTHVIHIINRLPTPLLKYKILFEMFYPEPPFIIHLEVFCCLCYASSLQAHITKFDTRARKVIFFDFKDGTKGYIIYDLNSHNIFVSRHVIFYETRFPFKTPQNTISSFTPKQDSYETPHLLDDNPELGPLAPPSAYTIDHSLTNHLSRPWSRNHPTTHNTPFVMPTFSLLDTSTTDIPTSSLLLRKSTRT